LGSPAHALDSRARARGAQVGRTKIITLHSVMWLENCTDRRVTFRLHTPISTLVAPPANARTDSTIGPLGPDEGAAGAGRAGASTALPVAAPGQGHWIPSGSLSAVLPCSACAPSAACSRAEVGVLAGLPLRGQSSHSMMLHSHGMPGMCRPPAAALACACLP